MRAFERAAWSLRMLPPCHRLTRGWGWGVEVTHSRNAAAVTEEQWVWGVGGAPGLSVPESSFVVPNRVGGAGGGVDWLFKGGRSHGAMRFVWLSLERRLESDKRLFLHPAPNCRLFRLLLRRPYG